MIALLVVGIFLLALGVLAFTAQFIARRSPLRCVECEAVIKTDSVSQTEAGICDNCLSKGTA